MQEVAMQELAVQELAPVLNARREFATSHPPSVSPRVEDYRAAPGKTQAPPRALVIDDAPDVADSLALLLQTLGADVQVAYGGVEGIEAVAAFQPALVFLDLGMPGMDGFETARRLRALPQGADVVLVALTGWGQQEDRNRTDQAGFDVHLTKPASVEALEDLLRGNSPARK